MKSTCQSGKHSVQLDMYHHHHVVIIIYLIEYKLIPCRGQLVYLPLYPLHIISAEHIAMPINTQLLLYSYLPLASTPQAVLKLLYSYCVISGHVIMSCKIPWSLFFCKDNEHFHQKIIESWTFSIYSPQIRSSADRHE